MSQPLPSTRPDLPLAGAPPGDRAFFGHPRGLSTLFFTELWERFSYYGMRAVLILFMTTPVVAGGLGFAVPKAGAVYGTYVAMVYLVALPGGWLADRVIGLRRAVFYGGVVIMLGHICLAIPSTATFYLGLVFIVLGTGPLKPSISALVGTLYTADDHRRDAGFSIYYMGINIGAFLAPLGVGFLAQGESFRRFLERVGIAPETCWHFGFGLAAVGMFLGLVQYVAGGRHLGDRGLEPVIESATKLAGLKRRLVAGAVGTVVAAGLVAALVSSGVVAISAEQVAGSLGVLLVGTTVVFFAWLFMSPGWTPQERKRLVVIAVLFVTSAVFWSAFEQAGSSLNLFAQNQTDSSVLGLSFPPSWFQSVNSFFIITLAPVFAWLWVWMGKNEPSITAKFSFGLVAVGAGFGVMFVAAKLAESGVKVSPMWLIVTYLLHTIGELSLSPVGLSAMTKLAPARVTGMMMGVWFLSLSMGGYIAGGIVTLYASMTQVQVFAAVTAFAVVAGVILALFIRPITRLEGSA